MEVTEESLKEEEKGQKQVEVTEAHEQVQKKKFLSPILVKSFDFPREELKGAIDSEEEENIVEEDETDEGERTKPLLVNKAKIAIKDLKSISYQEKIAGMQVAG